MMVPHHTAADKFEDGRLGAPHVGFPAAERRQGGKGFKAAASGCYLKLTEELSQIKEEVVKVV